MIVIDGTKNWKINKGEKISGLSLNKDDKFNFENEFLKAGH